MKEKLEQIKAEAVAKIQEADVPEKLNDVRVKFLGKKGELTAVLKGMKDVAPEERPKVGQLVNDTRKRIEEELENVAGGFGRPTMDDPRYREQMRINNMLKRGMKMDEIQKALKFYS